VNRPPARTMVEPDVHLAVTHYSPDPLSVWPTDTHILWELAR
jgi:hypothetical protein